MHEWVASHFTTSVGGLRLQQLAHFSACIVYLSFQHGSVDACSHLKYGLSSVVGRDSDVMVVWMQL